MELKRTTAGQYALVEGEGVWVADVFRDGKGMRKWRATDYYEVDVTRGTLKEVVATYHAEKEAKAKYNARLEAVRKEYEAICDKVETGERASGIATSAWHALMGAAENADLTAQEEGFEQQSVEWYGHALGGFDTNMGELDPSYGDPYTRNIEDDAVNKAGAFAPASDRLAERLLAHPEQNWVATTALRNAQFMGFACGEEASQFAIDACVAVFDNVRTVEASDELPVGAMVVMGRRVRETGFVSRPKPRGATVAYVRTEHGEGRVDVASLYVMEA